MTLREIDWNRVPIFGQRAPNVEYRLRPGAYAFIERAAGEIALVRTPEGVFLPGGGIEEGETPNSALLREALEECGFVIQVGAPVAHAVQFVLSRVERGHLEKRCIFMEAQLVSAVAAPTERDHELVWVSHEAAAELLAHTSQRWAVKVWSARR